MTRPTPIVRFGLVPGLILLPLTVLRAWLEVNHPDAAAMKVLSVFALGALWIILSSILMLRAGHSLWSMIKTAAVFAFIYRGAIAAAYALAWAYRWKTPSGGPTRYEVQLREFKMPEDASPWLVLVFNWVMPALIHVAFAALVWFIAWAIAFRARRPAVAAATPA